MTYYVIFKSTYLPEDEYYMKVTFVKDNIWKVERHVLDVFHGKETVTTTDVAQRIHADWWNWSSERGQNSFEMYTNDPEVRNNHGYLELESAVCDLENEMERRDDDPNDDEADFWNNMNEEEQRLWQEAEDWENSLMVEKLRKEVTVL